MGALLILTRNAQRELSEMERYQRLRSKREKMHGKNGAGLVHIRGGRVAVFIDCLLFMKRRKGREEKAP